MISCEAYSELSILSKTRCLKFDM